MNRVEALSRELGELDGVRPPLVIRDELDQALSEVQRLNDQIMQLLTD